MAFVFYLEVGTISSARVENPSILGFPITIKEIIKDKNSIEFTRFTEGRELLILTANQHNYFHNSSAFP